MVSAMQSKKLIVTLILASVWVSACGYKAPVYIPTPEQQRELDAREARIKARAEAAERLKKTSQATKQVNEASSQTSSPRK